MSYFVNHDGYAHAFDLDEWDIHLPLAASQRTEVTFTPEKAGTYTFYCGAPDHRAAGMTGTLVVAPWFVRFLSDLGLQNFEQLQRENTMFGISLMWLGILALTVLFGWLT